MYCATIAALAVGAAVAGLGDDREPRVGQLHGLRRGQRPAVQSVEGVAAQVVRGLGRLADARDHADLVRRKLKGDEGLLHGLENGEVAAAGTPGGLELAVIFNGDHSRSLPRPGPSGQPECTRG